MLYHTSAQAEAIKKTMIQNVKQALDNTVLTEDIERKTADLEIGSRKFLKDTRRLRCKKCLDYYKLYIIVFVTFCLVLLLILALANKI